jgi:hypothetical protein
MKRILFIVALVISALQINAQRLQETISAAKYQAQDTTTIAFQVPANVHIVFVEFTTLNAADAKLALLHVTYNGETAVLMDITGNPFTLNQTAATYRHITNFLGVAKTTYSIAITDDIWKGSIMGFDIIWNSVTTGNINIYW